MEASTGMQDKLVNYIRFTPSFNNLRARHLLIYKFYLDIFFNYYRLKDEEERPVEAENYLLQYVNPVHNFGAKNGKIVNHFKEGKYSAYASKFSKRQLLADLLSLRSFLTGLVDHFDLNVNLQEPVDTILFLEIHNQVPLLYSIFQALINHNPHKNMMQIPSDLLPKE